MVLSAKILIIDDEPDMLSGFAAILQALGHSAYPVSNGKIAKEILADTEFDIIFCDLQMPEMTGMQFLEMARKIAPDTPIVIFTAYGTINRAVEAMKNGAYDFIEKPINTDRLQNVLSNSLAQRKLYKERNLVKNSTPNRYGIENFIGKSKAIEKIFDILLQVSCSEANVLITGESGTGKEVIARCIHAQSPRKNKPFVPVNCGAFPEPLFESEVFGYEKGAFTGANRKKIGLLEFADKGVFFLDEVCELPLPLQVKMLRVMQDRNLRRLGGNELVHVNIRIISATNRDINRFVEIEKMRSDFFYRINVINIHLPPLRERENDIVLLAEFFLERALKTSLKDIKGFSPEVIDKFMCFNWPGNVRQLENVVERAVIMTNKNLITVDDLPTYLNGETIQEADSQAIPLTLQDAKHKLTSDIEKKTLLKLLEKHHGNITLVAGEAGMTRRNAHRLIKMHKIDPDNWRHN